MISLQIWCLLFLVASLFITMFQQPVSRGWYNIVWGALLSMGVHRLRFEHSLFFLPSNIYVTWFTNMRNRKRSRSTYIYSSTHFIHWQKCNINSFRWNGTWCAHALPCDQTSLEPISMCTAHHGQTRGPITVKVDHAFNSPTAQVQPVITCCFVVTGVCFWRESHNKRHSVYSSTLNNAFNLLAVAYGSHGRILRRTCTCNYLQNDRNGTISNIGVMNWLHCSSVLVFCPDSAAMLSNTCLVNKSPV